MNGATKIIKITLLITLSIKRVSLFIYVDYTTSSSHRCDISLLYNSIWRPCIKNLKLLKRYARPLHGPQQNLTGPPREKVYLSPNVDRLIYNLKLR